MSSYDLGTIFTVEDCQRLSVYDYLRELGIKSKERVLDIITEILGFRINLVTTAQFIGSRYWFLCPNCEHRIKIVLIHPLTHQVGCRHCLGVIYHKQRFRGMVELLYG